MSSSTVLEHSIVSVFTTPSVDRPASLDPVLSIDAVKLLQELPASAAGDVALRGADGSVIGVVIDPDEYVLLRAMETLLTSPSDREIAFGGGGAHTKQTLSFEDIFGNVAS